MTTGCFTFYLDSSYEDFYNVSLSALLVRNTMQAGAAVSNAPRKSTSVVHTVIIWAIRLLTDSRYYWHLFSLIFVGEVALCALVIRYVACEPYFIHHSHLRRRRA